MMQDLPPVQEKIVIVRKHKELSQEVRFSRDLWKQMEFQMELHEQSLEQFVTYAIELYVNELLKRETDQKKWIDFGEGQFSTTTRTNPIDIVNTPEEDIFKMSGQNG